MTINLSQLLQGIGTPALPATLGGTGMTSPGAAGAVPVSNGTAFVATPLKTLNNVSLLGAGNVTIAADQPHNLLMQHGII